jgi:hypothetical protein
MFLQLPSGTQIMGNLLRKTKSFYSEFSATATEITHCWKTTGFVFLMGIVLRTITRCLLL